MAKGNIVKGLSEDGNLRKGLPGSVDLNPHRRQMTPGNAHGGISDLSGLVEQGIYGFDQHDPRARPFILLRTQILNALAGMSGRVLAVTSPRARNGKSFVAANLSCAISRVQDACLIDLQFARPVIAERFGLPEHAGMASLLTGQVALSDIQIPIPGERLSVFPAGRPSQDPAELLISPLLDIFMTEVRALPGEPICLVDTPPVLEQDHMLLIARHVDAVLLVIEEGRTTRQEVADTLRLLGSTPVLGTLLNKTILSSS